MYMIAASVFRLLMLLHHSSQCWTFFFSVMDFMLFQRQFWIGVCVIYVLCINSNSVKQLFALSYDFIWLINYKPLPAGLRTKAQSSSSFFNFFRPTPVSLEVRSQSHPQPRTSTFCFSYQLSACCKGSRRILFFFKNITRPHVPTTGGPPDCIPFTNSVLIWQTWPRSPVSSPRGPCQVCVSAPTRHARPLPCYIVNKQEFRPKRSWLSSPDDSGTIYGSGNAARDNCKLNMSSQQER